MFSVPYPESISMGFQDSVLSFHSYIAMRKGRNSF